MTHLLIDFGHSLREGFFMFWQTLWALVLGFALSGIVQAFVCRHELERALGGRGARELGRATAFGAASSSCSYAAAAMAKTLFARGADFVSSMVFMFASTNLVLELGFVLWVLIGWQFAAAEAVGGLVMIALSRCRAPRVHAARAGGGAGSSRRGDRLPRARRGGHRGALCPRALPRRVGRTQRASLADLKMLRKEIAFGYLAAGFLAVLVPASAWRGLFVSGHGTWTTVENAFIGPLIAIVSFVCSIGNVPLAAALWQGGIGFAGVISFVFADLITLPLLLVYRRYYGGRLTLKLLGLFWVVMSAAGLAIAYLFEAGGILPSTRSVVVARTAFRWDATTFLDFLFLAVFGGLWWLARNQRRFGGGAGYAVDPVCGMRVQTGNAAAVATYQGQTLFFCSDGCRSRFRNEPERYRARVAT